MTKLGIVWGRKHFDQRFWCSRINLPRFAPSIDFIKHSSAYYFSSYTDLIMKCMKDHCAKRTPFFAQNSQITCKHERLFITRKSKTCVPKAFKIVTFLMVLKVPKDPTIIYQFSIWWHTVEKDFDMFVTWNFFWVFP